LYKYGLKNNNFPEQLTREDWDAAKNGVTKEPWKRALVCFFASYSARGWSGGYCLNSTRDYYNERLRDFQKQIPLLKDVEFIAKDYLQQTFIEGSVIYIDPPYFNTKKYDINKNFDYDDFWDKVRKDSEKNYVYVSEQIAPNDFKSIWSKQVNRNCFGANATKATENLFIFNQEAKND
jgi:site-specific DNA-adenine methylase